MKRVILIVGLLCNLAGAQGWEVLEPGFPVAGKPGEEVLLRFTGASGQKPVLRLGEKRYPASVGPDGTYAAQIVIGARAQQLVVDSNVGSQKLGEIAPLATPMSFVANSETVTRQGPSSDYDRLTPLYAGSRVRVDGRRGDWYRAAQSGSWLDGRTGRAEEGVLPPNRLNRVLVTDAPNGDARLTLECDRPAEVQVVHSTTGETLRVILPDTLQTCFDVKRPTDVAGFLGPILLRPHTSGQTEIELSAQVFSGYQITPNEQGVTLTIRRPIQGRFDGLKITVDAGHGGPKDPGTVGHGGLAEQELNLRVAKQLARLLETEGAQVLMTRTTDSDVATQSAGDSGELQARIDASVNAGSQLFLSLHHNARPSVEEGKKYHGTDIYWYQPQSRNLAQALADPIADAIGENLRSFRWRSFFVIRQAHSPAVLIEFQYLSNPTLEKSVLDTPDYPQKAAQAVVDGLRNYLELK